MEQQQQRQQVKQHAHLRRRHRREDTGINENNGRLVGIDSHEAE